MEEEKDIQSPAHPQNGNSDPLRESMEHQIMDNSDPQEPLKVRLSAVPHYEDLHAPGASRVNLEEIAADYARYGLTCIPDFSEHLDIDTEKVEPTLVRPYIPSYESGVMTLDELIAGAFVIVPRCSRIWTDDLLRIHWGSNTFYSHVTTVSDRNGPRLGHYIDLERLVNYENGEIKVRYDVFRKGRLVGVSEILKLVIRGSKTRPKQPSLSRAIRRRSIEPK